MLLLLVPVWQLHYSTVLLQYYITTLQCYSTIVPQCDATAVLQCDATAVLQYYSTTIPQAPAHAPAPGNGVVSPACRTYHIWPVRTPNGQSWRHCVAVRQHERTTVLQHYIILKSGQTNNRTKFETHPNAATNSASADALATNTNYWTYPKHATRHQTRIDKSSKKHIIPRLWPKPKNIKVTDTPARGKQGASPATLMVRPSRKQHHCAEWPQPWCRPLKKTQNTTSPKHIWSHTQRLIITLIGLKLLNWTQEGIMVSNSSNSFNKQRNWRNARKCCRHTMLQVHSVWSARHAWRSCAPAPEHRQDTAQCNDADDLRSTTVLQYDSTTVQLHNCSTTVLQYYSSTVVQYYSIPVLQCDSTTVLQCYSAMAVCSTTVLLQYYYSTTTVLLQYYNATVLLQYYYTVGL